MPKNVLKATGVPRQEHPARVEMLVVWSMQDRVRMLGAYLLRGPLMLAIDGE